MIRHIVARTTDIPPGGNKVVSIDGREIVVFMPMASSSRCSTAVRMKAPRSTRRYALRG
jgi:hypothetical protein